MRFVLAVAVLLAGCSSGPQPEHFSWSDDVASLDNPFPDVRFLDGTGGAQLRADYYRPFLMPKAVTGGSRRLFEKYIADGKTMLKGIGNFGATLLRTSVPVDPASLAGHFARLRKNGGTWEVLEADVFVEHSTASLDGTDATVGEGFPEFVFVRPSVPLPEGEDGLLVVKKGVKSLDGIELGRGREWEHSRLDLSGPAAALGIAETDIVLALELKAAPVSAPIASLKAFVDGPMGLAAVTVPAKGMQGDFPVGVWTSADSDWSVMTRLIGKYAWAMPGVASVGRVVIGTIAARDPRENGVWKGEWVADPSKAPVVPLRFVLSVPAGAKPAGGWPTVLGVHGVGGRNIPETGSDISYCLEHAAYLAPAGIACLGIDAPSHATRGNFLGFFDIENVGVMRENFREMTFDLLQVSRAAPNIDVDGDGQGDLSPELGVFANSLGAMMSSAFLPFDERVRYALLNVPGGGLSNILVSTVNRDRIGLLMVAKTGVVFDSAEYYSSFAVIRAVSQPFLEPADMVNTFRLIDGARPVLMQMGLGDQTIPNGTSRDLKAAAGLPELTASSMGTPVRGFTVIDPTKYGKPASYDAHNVFGDIAFTRTQALDFLRTKGTTFTVPP
ncbi:MAG: hypothetical protein JNK82_32360 [Myxococcaceae bacterium]|nr:hypothetical protein [Myxococcaceae bacterium]